MIKVKKDLTGMRFGRLVVIEQAEDYIDPQGYHRTQWKCKCDCDNIITIVGQSLKSGATKSCGCYMRDEASKRTPLLKKKYNTYDLETYDYGVGYTEKGEEFWFDKEDYDKIKNICWSYNASGYVVGLLDGRGTMVRLHRLVMGFKDKSTPIIDHIVHNKSNEHKYDNRKCNLRIVTSSQNAMNKYIQSNNTSGFPGVCFDTSINLWKAYIKINGKRKYLGSSHNKEDCIKLRKEAEEKYFGEYSFDNSQKTGTES